MRPLAVLALLTFVHVLNFVDRFLLQAFSVDIVAELHLTALQFTLLTGLVFTAFYTIGGLFAGALADRVNRPRLMTAGLVTWSALTAATGTVGSFAGIAATRLFTGVGEATLSPAALGMLADLWPRGRRALVAGIYYLAAPVGIGGAFILASTLGATIGWRHCFLALGLLGLLLAPALFALRDPRAHAGTRVAARPLRLLWREVAGTVAGSPTLALVMLAGVLVILAQGALVLDQLWLVQERGFGKQHAQALAGALFLAGGVLGTLVGGAGADALEKRLRGGRLWFLAGAYAIGVPVGIAYRFCDPASALFPACMFVGSLMVTVGYGPLFASLQDLVADELRSTMTAAMILAMTLLGTSVGNAAVGGLADAFRAAGVHDPITRAALIGTLPWALAIPCLVAAARRVRGGAA